MTKKVAVKPLKQQSVVIEIPPIEKGILEITLVGDSPLICHRWSEKAKREMLDKQMKKATQKKEAKDPERDFRESLYPFPGGGYGFPALAFKTAAVDACSHLSDITKVQARGAFHVIGELVKIHGDVTRREDMVTIGMGTADIRYRGEFKTWKTKVTVQFNTHILSKEQVVNLFNTAGFAIGVGEWRPQRDGNFGMFHVGSEAEVANRH